MPGRGIPAKEVVEGPPRRSTPSCCARPASRRWRNRSASWARTPPAPIPRAGEVEQRGIALTRKGRQRYDALLARIFRSNLGSAAQLLANEARAAFERDLGCAVHDEIALCEPPRPNRARVRALLGQAEDAALPA